LQDDGSTGDQSVVKLCRVLKEKIH